MIELPDCNHNGVYDKTDIADGTSPDCNGNGVPDECDIDPSDPDHNGLVSPDCNANGVPDECDIDPSDPDHNGQVSPDCNSNGVPDECDIDPSDPDENGQVSSDCNGNGVPDECDVWNVSSDCNGNNIPDECEGVNRVRNITLNRWYCTIQAAIDEAGNGHEILVGPGTYSGDGNYEIDYKGKTITVRSESGAASTIIEAAGHRGFYFHSFESSDAVLDGFTITQGSAGMGEGGGIYCSRSSPLIRNCTIEGNAAQTGGGLCCSQSGAQIVNCVIRNNGAPDLGGAGPGLACISNSNVVISGCTITGNVAEYGGGGVYCSASTLRLTGCTISGNGDRTEGRQAGGIHAQDASTLTVDNCVISGNASYSYPGAVYVNGGSATIVNCTITGNRASNAGGGISGGAVTSVINCIAWGNTGENSLQDNQVSGVSSINYSCVEGWTGTLGGAGNVGSDPRFKTAGHWNVSLVWVEGDYHLLANSPCIEKGSNAALAADVLTDMDGQKRIADYDGDCMAVVDIGVDEVQATAPQRCIVFVDARAAPGGDGRSWATAYQHLQDALAHVRASSGAVGEIWMAAGMYRPDRSSAHPEGTGERTVSFQLVDGLSIYGGFAGGEDPVTFDFAWRDFTAHETILSGDLAGNDGPDFTNRGENSGYIVLGASHALLEGLTIAASYTDGYTGGAAGLVSSTASPTIVRHCTFRDNSGWNGGGAAGHVVVEHSVFIHNRAGQFGAAVCNFTSVNYPVKVIGCFFAGNRALEGGALYVGSADATITNCVFTGNSANSYQDIAGGAIQVAGSGKQSIANCTFSGNTANTGGGAICAYAKTPAINIVNSVLWGNEAPNGAQLAVLPSWDGKQSSSATVSYCNVQGGQQGVLVGSGCTLAWDSASCRSDDPRLVNRGGLDGLMGTLDDNVRLLPGSPCIDGGNNAAVPAGSATDTDGNPRFVDDPAVTDTGAGVPPIVDMGAYESGPRAPADLDRDGDVDLADFLGFENCGSGPTLPVRLGCETCDLDRDGDVDQDDFGIFQRCYSGSGHPNDPNCAS